MSDKRKRPALAPPKSYARPVSVILEAEDYRKYYMVVMSGGTSGAETFRRLIRDAYNKLPQGDK